MSSNTRPSMPPNRRGECCACGQGIPYHGRRDLLTLARSWRLELERAIGASSSRLADAAIGVLQAARTVDAASHHLCVGCFEDRPLVDSPPPSRQLNLIPE